MSRGRFPLVSLTLSAGLVALLGYATYQTFTGDPLARVRAEEARALASHPEPAPQPAPPPEPRRKKTVADFLPQLQLNQAKAGLKRCDDDDVPDIKYTMKMNGNSAVQGTYVITVDLHGDAAGEHDLYIDALDGGGFLLYRQALNTTVPAGGTTVTAVIQIDAYTSLHEFRAHLINRTVDSASPDPFDPPKYEDLEVVEQKWRWVYTNEEPYAVSSSTAYVAANITLGNRGSTSIPVGSPVYFTNAGGTAIRRAGEIDATIAPGCTRTFQFMQPMRINDATPIGGVKVALTSKDKSAFGAELSAALKKH
jgi:hypothetical protein